MIDDKRLKLAKEALESGSYDKETIEYIFPELKKSEDERIRKAMLESFKYQQRESNTDKEWLNGIKLSEVVAWLEKQGQEQPKVSIWKHWKDGLAGNGEGVSIYLIKDGNTYSLSSCLGFECDYIELSELDDLILEKQKEQSHWKPTQEQMQALNWIAYNYTLMDKGKEEKLQSLYNDLKKF